MHFDQHVAVPDPAAGPEVYRQHARAWLRANLPDFMRSDSLDWRAPTLAESSAWEAAMYQAGLAGMTWPKPYGGHGLSLREHLAVNKEVGALPMPESVSSIGKELAGPIIMAVGTEAQKQAFLPNILSMKQYWCQGFSEPDAGSDLARLRTKAVQEGGQWRINGQKIWTSGAAKAHYCLLLTRTGTVADKHRGLLMFAVPMDTRASAWCPSSPSTASPRSPRCSSTMSSCPTARGWAPPTKAGAPPSAYCPSSGPPTACTVPGASNANCAS